MLVPPKPVLIKPSFAEGESTVKSPDAAGRTLPVRRSGSTTYDLHDQLGTATKQTNALASVTGAPTCDAFGTLVASTGTPQGPFGFAGTSGYQEDGATGLKLLGHRYYDPCTGRFLTRDQAMDGRNWYAYCGNNPTKYLDANGHLIWIAIAVIVIIVVIVAVIAHPLQNQGIGRGCLRWLRPSERPTLRLGR